MRVEFLTSNPIRINIYTYSSLFRILFQGFLAYLIISNIAAMNVIAQTYIPSSINTDTTWTVADSPYVANQDVTVELGVILTIEQGVVVKFYECRSLYIKGDLIADGASGGEITFTSVKDDSDGHDTNGDGAASTPTANDWGGLLFLETCAGSLLNDVVVRYGGREYSFPLWQQVPAIYVATFNLTISSSTITANGNEGIKAYQCNPTIENNTITNNGGDGIYLYSASPIVSGNMITNNGGYGIVARQSSDPQIIGNSIEGDAQWAICVDPSASGSSIQGNELFGLRAGIFVYAGELTADTVWSSDSVYVIDYTHSPYYDLDYNLNINEGATLTILPGVVTKFERFAGLRVYGTLIAEGTSDDHIIFTSLQDDSCGGDTNGDGDTTTPAKNDWGGIMLWTTCQQGVFNYVTVRYAGRTTDRICCYVAQAAIHVGTPNCQISNSVVSDNGYDGIQISLVSLTTSNVVVENNTISRNGDNAYGIVLAYGPAEIVRNVISENWRGMYLGDSPESSIYLNNFVDNTYGNAFSASSTTCWNSPEKLTYNYGGNSFINYLGNYWDDYQGIDIYGDGIGFPPYSVGIDFDNYPLIMPFENYTVDEEPPENQPPVANPDFVETNMGQSIEGNVLDNDYDPDGDELTAYSLSCPSHAESFTFNPDGSFSYTPEAGYTGQDGFTYYASDGELSDTATVTITIWPPPWSFVQITDPHIGYVGCLGEKDASTNLDATITQILELDPVPDFVLITGDIGDWGCTPFLNCWLHTNYDRFIESMKKLDEKGIPYYVVPGNHDRTYWEVCGMSVIKCDCSNDGLCCFAEHFSLGIPHFKHKGFLFVGFDSGAGHPTGEGLSNEQYHLLDALGQANPDMEKILFMHHPPLTHLEKTEGKVNGKTINFFDWCDENKVRLILAGHTHQNHISDRDGNPPNQAKPIYVQTASCGISRKLGEFDDDPIGFLEVNVNSHVNLQPYQTTKQNNMVKANLNSPGNLHIYDSAGGHVGIGDEGEIEYGIPDSFYHRHYTVKTEQGTEVFPENINIFDPSGLFLYVVVGTEGGTYGLNITSITEGIATIFESTDIPMSIGTKHVYALDWQALSAGKEGVILQIDADGDGIFERIVIADEDLTAAEFALQTRTSIDFEPDILNLRNQGKFVTVYVELPEGFDVINIDTSTLKLNDKVSALSTPITVGDYDEDGIVDLMVKFDRQQVIEVLGPGTQMVTLTGRLSDGRPIAGIDFIRVIDGIKAEATAPDFKSVTSERLIADTIEIPQPTTDELVDIGAKEAFDVKEGVGFMLFEAGGIISNLGLKSFNNEESAFQLTCAIDEVFRMLNEGMYFESLTFLENDILQRMDGCANTGQPDEDDWVTSSEGQALLYPLVTETIELMESLI